MLFLIDKRYLMDMKSTLLFERKLGQQLLGTPTL